VITGRVSGVSLSPSITSSTDTLSARAATSLKVTIVGTNITSSVDGSGQFTLTGVPPGDVTINFAGSGVSANITLKGVTAGQEIHIEVQLNGNNARIQSEDRRRRDDGDDDDDRDEIEGAVSGLSGTCPSLTFVVGGHTVKTSNATVFEDNSCSRVQNTVRVEVKGAIAADGTVTATHVEIDD